MHVCAGAEHFASLAFCVRVPNILNAKDLLVFEQTIFCFLLLLLLMLLPSLFEIILLLLLSLCSTENHAKAMMLS